MAKTTFGKKLGVAFVALALALSVLWGGVIVSNHQAAFGTNSVHVADGGTVPPPVHG